MAISDMTGLRTIIFFWLFLVMAVPSWAGQEAYVPRVPGAVSMTVGNPVIHELALKDTDIAEAIEIIAHKGGLNIITGERVKGKVTVFLKHVNAREALRIVLESNGLAYTEESGIIRVMTADDFLNKYGYPFGQSRTSRLIRLNFLAPADAQKFLEQIKSPQGRVVVDELAKTVLITDSSEKVKGMAAFLAELDVQTTTAALPLKNLRAEALVGDVQRLLSQGLGHVEVDVPANALRVTDTFTRVAKVRKAVEAMDARGRVILLEAKLVHVTLNDEHPDGVDWGGILEDHQRIRLPGRQPQFAGGMNGQALSYGMVANDDFPTLIEALDTVGIVQEYPLSAIRLTGEETALLRVRFDDPAIEMSVVPADSHDGADPSRLNGQVMAFTVKAAFDVTGDVETSVAPCGAADARENVLSAREGYTAVVGGMIIAARVSKAHKIPLLGDLPILGVAFRLEGSVRKEEFIVFLTPKSISLSQLLGDESPAGDAALTGEE